MKRKHWYPFRNIDECVFPDGLLLYADNRSKVQSNLAHPRIFYYFSPRIYIKNRKCISFSEHIYYIYNTLLYISYIQSYNIIIVICCIELLKLNYSIQYFIQMVCIISCCESVDQFLGKVVVFYFVYRLIRCVYLLLIISLNITLDH